MPNPPPSIIPPANIMSVKRWTWLSRGLGIPLATGFTITDGVGTVRSAMTITPSALIWPEIIAYFTGTQNNLTLYPDGTINGIVYNPMPKEVLDEVIGLVDELAELGTDTEEMEGGSIGSGAISGLRSKPSDRRNIITEYLRALVPFWTRYAYLLKQYGEDGYSHNINLAAAGAGGGSIPFRR